MIITLKYYHLKALLSCDLEFMVEVLVKEFGPNFMLQFEEMDEGDRLQASSQLGVMEGGVPVRGVDQRFWLLVPNEDGDVRRLEALERHIVEKGRK